MGIHNSSYLSTEWRVANHINMKAFMTICALLAGSASADPQYIQNLVSYKHPAGIPLVPYSLSALPLNPISYTNIIHPTIPSAIIPTTFIHQGIIKREAEPETPYAYGSKVVNLKDGSKYEFDVKVDKNGDGKSHQRVEQHDNTPVARDNYLMDQRMIEQNRMDRLRMDQMKQQVMEKNLLDMRKSEQMKKEQNRLDQRLMYQNQMDQRQTDQRMMSQNQMEQKLMDQNQMDQRMMSQNQMDQRMMARNQMSQNRMDQRMTNPMMRSQDQMDSRMYSMMGQREMGLMNQRMMDNSRRQMSGNRINQNVQDMECNQMQSRHMMKREAAGPSFAYTVSTGHPSEQSRHMMQLINYQMPIVDSIPLPSMHLVHPDGGLSYRVPSLMSYVLRPVNMFTGSRVDVQQDGQGYGFRTIA